MSQADDAPEGVRLARSKLSRETQRPPPDPQLAKDNRQFAFDLYAQLSNGQENVFFSPYSISTALAMAYAGARGETATELASALRFTRSETELHAGFNAIDLALEGRAAEVDAQEKTGLGFRLNTLNALFAPKEHGLLPSYLDTLARNYDSGLYVADFARDPERARAAINDWVHEKTEHRIDEPLPPGSISPLTVLTLINTIYFKASWKKKFDPAATKPEPFHAPSEEVTVPMMHGHGESYGRGADYQVLSLPYVSESVHAIFILPDAGSFRAVEARLGSGLFDEAVGALASASVVVSLPRFEYKTDYDLVPALETLGMKAAFRDEADFSRLFTEPAGIRITGIFHDAFVAMDEQGTEAAAATAVVFARKGSAPQPVAFTADRPFLFFIHDKPTGHILFAGRVLRPTE